MQFDRPVPGQSLTSTPKGAPYERPPEINDPLQALDYHLDILDDPKAVEQAMFFLEMGVDLVTLVEGITRNAVMEGMHSVDVSLIIAPVIHEYIKGYADNLEINYEEGFEDRDQEEKISYGRDLLLARKMLADRKERDDEEAGLIEQEGINLLDEQDNIDFDMAVDSDNLEMGKTIGDQEGQMASAEKKPQGLMARV